MKEFQQPFANYYVVFPLKPRCQHPKNLFPDSHLVPFIKNSFWKKGRLQSVYFRTKNLNLKLDPIKLRWLIYRNQTRPTVKHLMNLLTSLFAVILTPLHPTLSTSKLQITTIIDFSSQRLITLKRHSLIKHQRLIKEIASLFDPHLMRHAYIKKISVTNPR